MIDRQKPDAAWCVADHEGRLYDNTSWMASATVAVLMDIRRELQALNRVLGCHNAVDIPNILRRIDKNTRKKRKTKRGAK